MLPFHDPWFAYGVPALLLTLAGFGYGALWLQHRAFTRRFGPDPK